MKLLREIQYYHSSTYSDVTHLPQSCSESQEFLFAWGKNMRKYNDLDKSTVGLVTLNCSKWL